MTGILCDRRDEKRLPRALERAAVCSGEAEILVFTLRGVDLARRSAAGTLVTPRGAAPARRPLPRRIANLSVQRTAAGRRTLRALRELPGVTLLNPANRFDARAVREMLRSCPKLAPCLPGEEGAGGVLLRPARGEDLSRVRCFPPVRQGESAAPAPAGAGMEKLAVPALRAAAGRPMTVRSYLCRVPSGRWKECRRETVIPAGSGPPPAPTRGLALAAARCVARYLPDLAFCAADFVFSAEGAPVFLGLGGWHGLGRRGQPRRRLLAALCRVLENDAAALSGRARLPKTEPEGGRKADGTDDADALGEV